jgi:hypothetical protein
MFIQDSVSRIMSKVTLRVVYLAVDEPKGDPHSGGRGLNAPRPTYTSGRTENDI